MTRRFLGVSCALVILAAVGGAAWSAPPVLPDGVTTFPKGLTPAEAANYDRALNERLASMSIPSFMDPSVAAIAKGPLLIPGMAPAGEFEWVDAIVFGVDGPSAAVFPDLFESMAFALNGEIDVYLVTQSNYRPVLRNALVNTYGLDPDAPGNTVKIFETPLNSVWLRDYGPIWVKNPRGRDIMVNPVYYPERPADDDNPYYMSAKLDMLITSPTMTFEGGNFLANGAGTCIASTGVIDGPTGNVWQGWTEGDVISVFQSYYGCTEIIIIDRLQREGTTHIDMWMAVLDESTIMVGEYPVASGTAGCAATRCYPASGVDGTMATALDGANRTILDNNAARFAAAGFNVVRIPMPNHQNDVWRTYTNVLFSNETVLVPVYASGGLVDVAVEAAALQIWADETGRNIVSIDAEGIIYWSGAIHCVAQTLNYGASYPSNSDECLDGTATHCGIPDVIDAEVEDVEPETGCSIVRTPVAGSDGPSGGLVTFAFVALCIGGLFLLRRR